MAVTLSDRAKELLEFESQYTAGGFHDPMPAVITKAKGVKLWDIDGKEYLDFTCMLSAVNQGHSHPAIIEAVVKQMHDASLVNIAAHTAIWPPFAQMMCQRFGYDKILPLVSGTEAVEAACKIARKWGINVKGIPADELLILGLSGCFHGLSIAMWSLQDKTPKRAAYGIADPRLTCYDPKTEEPLSYGNTGRIKACIEHHHARIAAVVIEPIRGQLRTFAEEISYSTKLYDLCKEYNILFIADEIRMGCGKTGRFLSSDHLGASRKPDLIALGKSLSGGVYPVSFVLGRSECMDLVGEKEIVSTYSFSPLAITATTAALRVIDDECLIERAGQIEKKFLEVAETWRHPFIRYATARGADFFIFFWRIDQNTCRRICEICMHNGLLVYPNGLGIRMSIAMVITDEELRAGLEILSNAFDTVFSDLTRYRALVG
ncbi:acetylornithine aminotransferase, putative [Talaromyces stipitatus ATCC 10500]|uniref:Ornithine aminotransferase n=1 Tax=Talaromyces stipitatus (strain ATCC 10500 / CBS 375.48 / QM 6759 / NRRL 1006) TaxID=441959 RepID=B8MSK1_TALSN|nr:acetylornithine aminotransferase, putative [Talaromyces stipitatus ATCC 10500]EED12081.1 acetylornithine aminotransferase, putative [Talaromyces stipitatus ATCC 10500]